MTNKFLLIEYEEDIKMPKLKTKKAVSKRFKVTGSGQLSRHKANTQHILGKKSTKRKRNLRKSTLTDKTVLNSIKKKLLPYA